jgi:hypothetical protein
MFSFHVEAQYIYFFPQIYKLFYYSNKEKFIHICGLEINTLIERKIYTVDNSGSRKSFGACLDIMM